MPNKLQLLIATGNAHKIHEIKQILADYPFTFLALPDVAPKYPQGVFEVEETGSTYMENALIKARHFHKITGLPCLADDSGLEVQALNNAPGLYSNRFGGVNTPHSEKIQMLLKELENVPDSKRNARFCCTAVTCGLGDEPLVALGICDGVIAHEPSGQGGFGYDPIFFVPHLKKTVAQLEEGEKNNISHRGKAMRALAQQILNLPR